MYMYMYVYSRPVHDVQIVLHVLKIVRRSLTEVQQFCKCYIMYMYTSTL